MFVWRYVRRLVAWRMHAQWIDTAVDMYVYWNDMVIKLYTLWTPGSRHGKDTAEYRQLAAHTRAHTSRTYPHIPTVGRTYQACRVGDASREAQTLLGGPLGYVRRYVRVCARQVLWALSV